MAPDIATCMSYTGIDPFTGPAVAVGKGLRGRKAQRALMQCLEPATGRSKDTDATTAYNASSRRTAVARTRITDLATSETPGGSPEDPS